MATTRKTGAATAAKSGRSDAKTSDDTGQEPVEDPAAVGEPETAQTPPPKPEPAALPAAPAAPAETANAAAPEAPAEDEAKPLEEKHPPAYFAALARVLLDTETTTAEAALAAVDADDEITLADAKNHVRDYLSRPVEFAGQILVDPKPKAEAEADAEAGDAAEATEETE